MLRDNKKFILNTKLITFIIYFKNYLKNIRIGQ